MGEAGPSEKRQVEGQRRRGNIYLTLRKATNKYQKRITETGPAKTDFTRSTASPCSLQIVLEAKWIRGGGRRWVYPEYPHIYKLWASLYQTHGFTEEYTRHFTRRILFVSAYSQIRPVGPTQAAGTQISLYTFPLLNITALVLPGPFPPRDPATRDLGLGSGEGGGRGGRKETQSWTPSPRPAQLGPALPNHPTSTAAP